MPFGGSPWRGLYKIRSFLTFLRKSAEKAVKNVKSMLNIEGPEDTQWWSDEAAGRKQERKETILSLAKSQNLTWSRTYIERTADRVREEKGKEAAG